MVDWHLIHVYNEICVATTIVKAGMDVLEEFERLSFDLSRVSLGHVGGNLVCQVVFGEEARETDLCSPFSLV